ncbi:MAG: O-antigen ligase family protein [Pyrinomonadaceae bacterium]
MLRRISYFLVCATPLAATMFYGAVHQPVIAAFYLVIAFIVTFLTLNLWGQKEIWISTSLLQLPIWLLCGYAFFQLIPFGSIGPISLDPYSTQITAVHIAALAAFFSVALIVINSAERLRRLGTILTIFGCVYAFYAILQSLLSPDAIYGLYKPQSARPFGSFVNRHDFAAIIEMTIAIPLGLMFVGAVDRDKRLIYVVAVGVMGTSLLLSGSRGGLVAVIAAVILLVLMTSRAKGARNLVLKAGLSAALLVAAIGGAVFVGGDTSLTRFSDLAATDNISSSRTHIWRVTLDVIAENFPLGAGLGAFTQAYAASDTSSGALRVEQAHNDYLQIVADAGIVGLLLGGFFLVVFFQAGIRSTAARDKTLQGLALGAFAGCFAVLVHSLFDFVLHITAVTLMFLILLAVLVAAGRRSDEGVEDVSSVKPANKATVTPLRRIA